MKIGYKTIIYLGPPGTGKTRRLNREVSQRKPSKFYYTAFTKKAAAEARERAQHGSDSDYRTIHSLAYRLLGASKGDMMDWDDYKDIGNSINAKFSKFYDAEEAAIGGQAEGDKLRAIVDLAAASCLTPDEVLHRDGVDLDKWRLKRYIDTLDMYKKDTSKIDFNDLLTRIPKEVKSLALDLAVIDEAQDLSRLQWVVAAHLFAKTKVVLIAGDDDQAIFRWAGADVKTFLTLDATSEVLEQSFRCPRSVAEIAQTISSRINDRYEKKWNARDADGNVDFVGSIEDVDVTSPGTHLLLARNGYLLAEWEKHCRAKGIPYQIRNKLGVDKDHIRAIRDWESFRRTNELRDRALVAKYTNKPLGRNSPHRTLAWFDAFNLMSPDDIAFYRQALSNGESLDKPPRVHISTIHGSKGGEADHVAVLSDRSYRTNTAAEKSPDDEHRVMYVAVSRSKDRLTIVRPRGTTAYPF